MPTPPPVTFRDILLAARRIAPHIRRTPTERSAVLSAELGAEIWLKLECQQRTGSFKLRGALNRLLTLPDDARARGVLTCSAGNHGLGLAEAARLTGIAATIVVPQNASTAKVEALRRSGVELLLIGRDYDEAEAQAPAIARERGLAFVSPYDDPAVIAGAGTVALEALLDLPETGTILVPVGGGGLASGIGLAARALLPGVRIIGVQSVASAAMTASLAAGELVPVASDPTLADGLAGNIAAGSITFPLVRDTLDEVLTVSEGSIARAMHTFLDRHHLIVEGSGAVGLAALQEGLLADTPGPLLLIVSGSNVATKTLAGVLNRSVE
ncbi:MAG TPA: threonine/serine dehydratase [Thermomicrobiales bacterium]|jgi:threonine dehydratase